MRPLSLKIVIVHVNVHFTLGMHFNSSFYSAPFHRLFRVHKYSKVCLINRHRITIQIVMPICQCLILCNEVLSIFTLLSINLHYSLNPKPKTHHNKPILVLHCTPQIIKRISCLFPSCIVLLQDILCNLFLY